MDLTARLAAECSLRPQQVEAVIRLLDEGCTIPFIARYRKEAHGSLDDQTIRSLVERLQYLRGLEERRAEILSAITEQGNLTPELAQALDAASTLAGLEDIYRPYRPKRRTRATIAREKGLEPLAQQILLQLPGSRPEQLAQAFLNPDQEVLSIEDALSGASDILAEQISDNAQIRQELRALFQKRGTATAAATEPDTEENVYSTYFDFTRPVDKLAPHQILALDRGEREKQLKVRITAAEDTAMQIISAAVCSTGNSPCTQFVLEAGRDAYHRLIAPSVEREIRSLLTERAAKHAIGLFADNLHQLLMQPPIRDKVVLGLDPGYRTGCKAAVVDATGAVLDTGVLYITHSQRQRESAAETVHELIRRHNIDILAIGNGTASRETEQFASEIIKEAQRPVSYIIVNEAGASVYSASRLAAEEFPQFDLTLRSAVSIARRLQDPLAELVKIEPKAIGVGQYQHDMPKKELEQALDSVVERCVNAVGVDLNTASAPLLERISGISGTVAKNIVRYREENGPFTSRTALKKVPKLGPKAFEQSAGFLRIHQSKQVLDATAVHPESYPAAKHLLELTGFKLEDVAAGRLGMLEQAVQQSGRRQLADTLGIGLPTLDDIIQELMKPGRDPREDMPKPILQTDVLDIKDLKPGMRLQGTVRNVIDFGAFVDIGVHQDGLVHISQMADRFIRHPSEVVKVGDVVQVSVLETDLKRGRISLTMKEEKGAVT
ncbi:MAG: RNA-binding transcriptional accessory protein [Clostridiales bacterium]|nr:RNA-binding transcriptional accessory protein [Clostridiales bacterium]